MATLVLGAVGTLVGGPVGGAIGALAGRAVDNKIIGGTSVEGPRLKDLSLTTSTYGAPIARHFGTMRVGGSIIWATDLQETSETGGGGKGRPETTSFSYSVSLAIALSSRPIIDIGRIWADGDLLRGKAGDLKTGGTLRVYKGHGDQLRDPLIEAAEGSAAPAFRNCAYVVFENLQLEDFGNRIPALTFEVISDQEAVSSSMLVEPVSGPVEAQIYYDGMSGFSDEGGALAAQLTPLGNLFPFATQYGGDALVLSAIQGGTEDVAELAPSATGADDGEFGETTGYSLKRRSEPAQQPSALRYYDPARDYQPGVQRALGRTTGSPGATIEFPAAMSADTARLLIGSAATRIRYSNETLHWRLAELDPSLQPGCLVRAPGVDGPWIVDEWEWRNAGVELLLRRAPPRLTSSAQGDSGVYNSAPDLVSGHSILSAFELPWDGTGSPNRPMTFAAIGSQNAAWRGASLYNVSGAALEPVGTAGRRQSVIGELVNNMDPSPALMLEAGSTIEVDTLTAEATFASVSTNDIAMGRNRLLVGEEIVQFMDAEQISEKRWRLSGLLRGRGGTEVAAQDGGPAGAMVVLLDAHLVPLVAQEVAEIAVIGAGDTTPVAAAISSAGRSTKPLSPVHPRVVETSGGDIELCWTRRARGAWNWPDHVETPLNEEREEYRVGIGPTASPLVSWEITEPRLIVTAGQRAALSGSSIWVRQVGQFGQSPPLFLTIF